jgi:hypothetical protein
MIRRNTWIVLGAFAVVALLALILFQAESEQPKSEATPPPDPFWSVRSSDIAAMVVEDLTAGRVLKFERHEEELWRMVQPEQGEADVVRVERAASWLSSPSPRAQLPADSDLPEFRLDHPEYRIDVLLSNGEVKSFLVGRETPTGGSRYVVLPSSERIWIVSLLGLDEVLDLLETYQLPSTEG